ncbi:GGDEF domain-containing protein [Vibrio mexicanus]|uniref:GGDEF domain-containing protein n=1 Tax=Vibrio mexicanus TaxID=1004326 RepID=UPI00069BC6CC|nr:GGDEF domain-containing protein [Vibrio mexicanus]
MKFSVLHNKASLVVLGSILLMGYVMIQFPRIAPNSIDVGLELVQLLICFYLLYRLHELRDASTTFTALFIALTLLVIGNLLDLLDEFYALNELLDVGEDVLTTTGFMLFILACVQWVNQYKKRFDQMKHLAEIDSLTGIPNRRAFLKLTEEYFEINEQLFEKMSVLVIDIDNFKDINDKYGHPFGDEVLVQVANAIKLGLRKGDYVARLGGEEFVVLLKNTNEQEADTTAHRILDSINKMRVYHSGKSVTCTASIGGATSSAHPFEFEKLYDLADKSLYQAKSRGRNRYCANQDAA